MISWREVKLGDICEITSSKRIFMADYVDSGIPFYRSKEIIEKQRGNNISTELFITEEKYEEIKQKFSVPQEGDILLTSVGTLGIPYIVRENEKFYFKDGNLTWIKKSKNFLPEYLYYYLISDEGKFKLENISIGTTQKAITIVGLKGLEISLPPLDIQKKIAGVLGALDDKIELNNKINNNLEQQAQALFKSWFVDREYEVEKDTTLGVVCKCELGGTPSRVKPEYWNGNIAWINSGEVNNFRIIKASEYITEIGLKHSATKLLPRKTTVIAITGATLGQISLLEIDSCTNQSVVGILENETLPYEFIYPYICHNIKELLSHQTGGAQQHINKQNVEQIALSLPKATLIKDYKNIVSPIFELIATNCFESERLSALRDALLPKLMSGEIDVSKVDINELNAADMLL